MVSNVVYLNITKIDKMENSQIATDAVVALLRQADKTQYFQICIKGNPVSFHGVRAFASVAVAKSTLNKQFQLIIGGYRTGGKAISKHFGISDSARHGDKSISKAAKEVIDIMIAEGVLTFEKI